MSYKSLSTQFATELSDRILNSYIKYGIILSMHDERPLEWIASSKEDYSRFPEAVKDSLGFALHLVQQDEDPNYARGVRAKPLKGFGGTSVMEIIERHDTNTYRAIYTAKIDKHVYVLHCFQKKSKSGIKTPISDVKIIQARFKAVKENVKNER